MTRNQTTAPSMYCCKCGYQLSGLSENRCPECGRPFDPGNRRTFALRPDQWLCTRRNRRAAPILGLMAALILGFYTWLYVGWRVERSAIAAIQALGGNVQTARFNPLWIGRLFIVIPFDYLRQRVTDVDLGSTLASDTDIAQLRNFHELTRLNLQNTCATDTCIAHLTSLPRLRDINLSHTQVTDQALAQLRQMRDIRYLHLSDTRITDAGLTCLSGMTRLRSLSLHHTNITDNCLPVLQGITSLEVLSLGHTAMTPSAIVQLLALPRLSELRLAPDQMTAAVHQMQQKRGYLSVVIDPP